MASIPIQAHQPHQNGLTQPVAEQTPFARPFPPGHSIISPLCTISPFAQRNKINEAVSIIYSFRNMKQNHQLSMACIFFSKSGVMILPSTASTFLMKIPKFSYSCRGVFSLLLSLLHINFTNVYTIKLMK